MMGEGITDKGSGPSTDERLKPGSTDLDPAASRAIPGNEKRKAGAASPSRDDPAQDTHS